MDAVRHDHDCHTCGNSGFGLPMAHVAYVIRRAICDGQEKILLPGTCHICREAKR